MLDRIRRRLTMGYVGILALILILFGAIVVVSFSRQVTAQQDELLEQKARAEANGPLYNGDEYGGLIKATTDSDVAVVAILPDGSMDDVLDLNPSARSSLGLPFAGLARQAGREGRVISETVDGPDGPVRVVSVPLFDETGEVVDVIQAAQLRRVVWGTVERLIFVLVPVGLGALLLAAIGGLYVSRRAMQPVRDSFQRQRTFIADASHELKTPLTLIRADAEVLSRGLTDPDHRQLANDLLAETDRMNALLSDLLTLARLDAGKLTVEQKPFDLTAAIAETAERFGARAVAEEVRLEVDTPDKLVARGDPERTAQILAALLDNALRFTPSGGAVEIAAHAQDGRIEASVADTGPGISPEHLPHVFDRFYRVETARTRASGGTGLGLAIARDLARAQGGELAAGNGQNGGASFTLKLPAGS